MELSLIGARALGLCRYHCISQSLGQAALRKGTAPEQNGFPQLRGTSAASFRSSALYGPGEMCVLVQRRGDGDSIPESTIQSPGNVEGTLGVQARNQENIQDSFPVLSVCF